MALSLIEPANLPEPNAFIGENYQLTLKQSMRSLLPQIHKETPIFSHFVDVFYQLMQVKIDPPLESIWVYSALSFHGHKSANEDPLNRIAVTEDLFKFISACSGSCNSSKSIGLLAPVFLDVYKLVVELFGKNLGSKREKKAMRKIKSLIEVILGYISMCCDKSLNEESNDIYLSLIMPIADLVHVWVEGDEGLESFFPLVSSQIHRKITEEDCDVNYVAGVVIVEAFLLKLFLDFQLGVAGVEFEKELRSWAVGSITGFRNFYFFEILVSMLLEPTLPVTSLLNSKDGVWLRKVLYDAVILVEYSFLNPERVVNPPAERMKTLAMTRVIVTHEAIEFSREDGDQERAISYTSAFSSSRLLSQIMKSIPIGMEEGASRTNGSSPKALIKWLLNLEQQGINVFEDSPLKRRALLAIDNSRADYEQPSSTVEGKKVDADLLFYIDNKVEEEDGDEDKRTNELMSAAFVTAAQAMKLTDNGGKKRKESESAGKKKKIKYVKYDLCHDSDLARERLSSVSNDGLSGESEVEDPLSDEDVEAKEQ